MKQSVFSLLLVGAFLLFGNESHAQALAKARVMELTGEVRFKNPGDADWQAVSKGMELPEGGTIFTGPDSDCQLSFGDDFKSVTRIKPDSRVVLKSISTQPQLDITTGEVFALVRNLKQESSFRVTTPTAVATVRGTAFSFAADGIGSEIQSTVQVYESIVGLNPIDNPNAEVPIEEGHGAMMSPDGKIEKEFELSPEEMQTGKEFMNEALDVMGLDRPDPVAIPESKPETQSSEEGSGSDEEKKMGGPNPPGPDSGGGPSDARVDSAVDGVVMDMAQDSEFSKSETFGGSAMNRMFEHLADLNGDGTMRSPMDSVMYAETVKSAIEQTDYFRNMPPEVQERMMETIDRHIESGGPMVGPEGGFSLDGRPLFMPDGGTYHTGSEPYLGTMMDPSFMNLSPDTFLDPNDLASVINENSTLPPHELQSIINFMFAIRQDYDNYKAANAGSDAGYYGSQRIITNFDFIKNDVPYTGSIKFTPIDADLSPSTGVHDHDGPDFLHLTSVAVTDDPGGVGGNVVVSPGTIEVPTAA